MSIEHYYHWSDNEVFAMNYPQWAHLIKPERDETFEWLYAGPNNEESFGNVLRGWPIDAENHIAPLGYEHAVFVGDRGHGIYVRPRARRTWDQRA